MRVFNAAAGILFLCGMITQSTAAQEAPRNIAVQFRARVGVQPFRCDLEYDNIGAARSRIRPRDLRFFVTQVELITTDGHTVQVDLKQDGVWQYKNLALLDFEDGTGGCVNGNIGINQQVVGTVPAGQYAGLRFTLGVPIELDHLNSTTAPSPLNTSAMFWSWQDGFKFIRAEVVVPVDRRTAPHPANGFPFHVGSTGCSSTDAMSAPATECLHPNRVTVGFPKFDPDHDSIVFDLATLLAGVDLAQQSSGCMSFPGTPTCTAPMRALGLTYDGAAASEQTVFHLENKP